MLGRWPGPTLWPWLAPPPRQVCQLRDEDDARTDDDEGPDDGEDKTAPSDPLGPKHFWVLRRHVRRAVARGTHVSRAAARAEGLAAAADWARVAGMTDGRVAYIDDRQVWREGG